MQKCTAGQLALAWVLAQGDDVVPIPGTKRVKYLEENIAALDVKLSDAEVKELSSIIPPEAVSPFPSPPSPSPWHLSLFVQESRKAFL